MAGGGGTALILALALLALVQQNSQTPTQPPNPQDGELRYIRRQSLLEPGIKGNLAATVQMPVTQIDPLKRSPRKELGLFAFTSSGYGALPDWKNTEILRLAVYAQRRGDEMADFSIAQSLMRLWFFNYQKLGLDHNRTYKDGVIDVYLSWSSTEPAGGEQAFETDPDFRARLSNNIYIYGLERFPEKIELLREICHEYGHATLPPINGFDQPENFANGMLGEKLYMRYLRDCYRRRSVAENDVLGVKKLELEKFVAKEVDPLIRVALQRPPSVASFDLKGTAGMNNWLGVVLAMQAVAPSQVFANGLKAMETKKGASFVKALERAVAETQQAEFKVPAELNLTEVWLPTGTGKLLVGKATKTVGLWQLVQLVNGRAVLMNRPADKNFMPSPPEFGH